MSRTITAMFDSRTEAEAAREQLRTEVGADAKIIDKSSTGSTGESGESRGFWSDLKEMFVAEDDRSSYEEGVDRGGFLLCASVPEEQADRACDLLDGSGSVDFQEREQQWRSEGSSSNRDRRETSGRAGMAGEQGNIVDEERIPVVQEQLRVGKREEQRGGARVRSYVEERPVSEHVNLREEHVTVERHAVDEPISPSALDQSGMLQEREIEMRETAERPVVSKEARVKEEVVLQKTAREHSETIEDKVRNTKVDVAEDRADNEPGAFRLEKDSETTNHDSNHTFDPGTSRH